MKTLKYSVMLLGNTCMEDDYYFQLTPLKRQCTKSRVHRPNVKTNQTLLILYLTLYQHKNKNMMHLL